MVEDRDIHNLTLTGNWTQVYETNARILETISLTT